MTKDEARQCVQKMYDIFNAGEIDRADEVLAPDFYSHPLKGGVEAVKKSWAATRQAFPDIRVVVEDLLADGDKVASRTRIHGMKAGSGDTQPMIMEFIRLKDGRIAEIWGLTDIKR
jgi:ketosteroid isomerase-like protein